MVKLFGSMTLEDLITCDMEMCGDNKCVWIMVSFNFVIANPQCGLS